MSEDTYQVQTAMGKEETVSKQAQTNVEIAGFNTPHTFLMGKFAPNCILGSIFLEKTATEVDFKANELHLHQGDKNETEPL